MCGPVRPFCCSRCSSSDLYELEIKPCLPLEGLERIHQLHTEAKNKQKKTMSDWMHRGEAADESNYDQLYVQLEGRATDGPMIDPLLAAAKKCPAWKSGRCIESEETRRCYECKHSSKKGLSRKIPDDLDQTLKFFEMLQRPFVGNAIWFRENWIQQSHKSSKALREAQMLTGKMEAAAKKREEDHKTLQEKYDSESALWVEERARLQAQQDDLKKEQETFEKSKAEHETSTKTLQKEKDDFEEKKSAAEKDRSKHEKEKKELEAKIATLKTTLTKEQQKLETKKTAIEKTIEELKKKETEVKSKISAHEADYQQKCDALKAKLESEGDVAKEEREKLDSEAQTRRDEKEDKFDEEKKDWNRVKYEVLEAQRGRLIEENAEKLVEEKQDILTKLRLGNEYWRITTEARLKQESSATYRLLLEREQYAWKDRVGKFIDTVTQANELLHEYVFPQEFSDASETLVGDDIEGMGAGDVTEEDSKLLYYRGAKGAKEKSKNLRRRATIAEGRRNLLSAKCDDIVGGDGRKNIKRQKSETVGSL